MKLRDFIAKVNASSFEIPQTISRRSNSSRIKDDFKPDFATLVSSLGGFNPREAWKNYSNYNEKLPHYNHSQMLSHLIQHVRPSTSASHANTILRNIINSGFSPTILDCNNLLAVYYRNNDLDSVTRIFDLFIQSSKKIIPTPRTFHLVMAAYSIRGKPKNALLLFEQMIDRIPSALSDPIAHAIIIDAFCAPNRRSFEDLDSIYWLLDHYIWASSSPIKNIEKFLLSPTIDQQLYDSSIRAIGLCGDKKKSLYLYENNTAIHGVTTYDAILEMLLTHGDIGGMEEIWKENSRLKSNGHRREYYEASNCLLRSSMIFMMKGYLKQGRNSDVVAIFKELTEHHLPNEEAYQILYAATGGEAIENIINEAGYVVRVGGID